MGAQAHCFLSNGEVDFRNLLLLDSGASLEEDVIRVSVVDALVHLHNVARNSIDMLGKPEVERCLVARLKSNIAYSPKLGTLLTGATRRRAAAPSAKKGGR